MSDGPPFDTVKVASYVPRRRPEWKPHFTVGRARASIAQHVGGIYGPGEVWEATPTGSWLRVHPAPERTP